MGLGGRTSSNPLGPERLHDRRRFRLERFPIRRNQPAPSPGRPKPPMGDRRLWVAGRGSGLEPIPRKRRMLYIAVSTPDLRGLCEMLEKEGVEIPRPPGPLPHGGGNIIALVKDPDVFLIELGERA